MNIVDRAVKILNKKYGIAYIDDAIVVGSGLIQGTPDLENPTIINYKELGLPKSKVKGHTGNLIVGKFGNRVVALVSRMHYYESGDIKKVRIPFEILEKLGVSRIVLMTSSGGLNKSFKVGDIMLIEDHINMSGVNPLVGIEEMTFTDMSNCYSRELRDKVKQITKEKDIDIREGVFCQMSGPSYETNAEVEMLRKIGADAVSMSTAHDCIIANYLGMKVLGFSVIVNVFSSNTKELTHEEVLDNAEKACQKVKLILSSLLK